MTYLGVWYFLILASLCNQLLYMITCFRCIVLLLFVQLPIPIFCFCHTFIKALSSLLFPPCFCFFVQICDRGKNRPNPHAKFKRETSFGKGNQTTEHALGSSVENIIYIMFCNVFICLEVVVRLIEACMSEIHLICDN